MLRHRLTHPQVERLKGLQLKFTAFYKLLVECPHLAETVVLLQLGISVHEREQDYHQCLKELRTLALKINAEFAPSPDRPVIVLEVRIFHVTQHNVPPPPGYRVPSVDTV